jgi:hypothetical protein
MAWSALLGSGDEMIGVGIGFAALCVSMAAYYITVEWRKARQAQLDADLKREMIQKGMAAEDVGRVLKAASPPRE